MSGPESHREVGGDQLLAGRYRLGHLLGRGGMGAVWTGYDEVLQREIAIKELTPAPGLNDDQREELNQWMLREARAAGRIDHPSAVTIYDVFELDGRPWIVMRLLAGRSMAEMLNRDGP